MSRAVHIDGYEYVYSIRQWSVVARTPDGRTLHARHCELTGQSVYDSERDDWKGNKVAITPAMVKRWLIRKLNE